MKWASNRVLGSRQTSYTERVGMIVWPLRNSHPLSPYEEILQGVLNAIHCFSALHYEPRSPTGGGGNIKLKFPNPTPTCTFQPRTMWASSFRWTRVSDGCGGGRREISNRIPRSQSKSNFPDFPSLDYTCFVGNAGVSQPVIWTLCHDISYLAGRRGTHCSCTSNAVLLSLTYYTTHSL